MTKKDFNFDFKSSKVFSKKIK